MAKDEDSGDNAKVNYMIVSGNTTLFHVHPTSGVLSSESLNFEESKNHVFTMTVMATDRGHPPRSSIATVKVLVKNVNDPPKFESDTITGTANLTHINHAPQPRFSTTV